MTPNKTTIQELDGWSAVEAGSSGPGRRRYIYGKKLRGYYVEVIHQPDEEFWKFSWSIHSSAYLRGGLKDGEVWEVLLRMSGFIGTLREFGLLPPSDEEFDSMKKGET